MTFLFSLIFQSIQSIRNLLSEWEPGNLDFWVSILIATLIIYTFQEIGKNDHSFHDR